MIDIYTERKDSKDWIFYNQLLARKKTLYMNPVNQTVDIDECKKFIEFAKILW